jgi:hypothetical protein
MGFKAVSKLWVRHILKTGLIGLSKFLLNQCPEMGNHLGLSLLLFPAFYKSNDMPAMSACFHNEWKPVNMQEPRDDVMAVGQSLRWAQEKELMINRYGVTE